MADSGHDSYFVSIRNRSSITANYAVIFAPPLVTPHIDPIDVSTPIVCSFRSVPSGNGAAVFEIPKQLHAVCGTAICGTPETGPLLEIYDQRPVTCTQLLIKGQYQAGTALIVNTDDVQPAFDDKVAQSSEPGTFSIQTQADFTAADAKQRGYFVGISGPWTGTSSHKRFGWYSTFVPKPNTTYHIQPRPIIGILLGSFQPRSNFIGMVEDILEVDFAQLGDSVEITHNDRNQLVIHREHVLFNEVTL